LNDHSLLYLELVSSESNSIDLSAIPSSQGERGHHLGEKLRVREPCTVKRWGSKHELYQLLILFYIKAQRTRLEACLEVDNQA
jgi:hypothetical protein